MGTLAFYGFIIILCAGFAGLAVRKNQKWWLLAAVVLLSFVAGCRALSVGTDTSAVTAALIRDMGRPVFDHSKDFLYYAFCKLLMLIWENPSFVLTVLALLTNAAIFLRLWDFAGEICMPAAVCIYGMFYFGTSMNITRQILAVAIIFYVSRYLFRQKYLPFCLGAVAAVFIHASACMAVLLLAVYLFYYDFPGIRRIRIRRRWIALGAALIGLVLVIFLGIQYRDYLVFSGVRIGIMQPVQICVLGAVYVLACRAKGQDRADDPDWKNFRFIFLLSLVGYGFSLAGYLLEELGRMNYYFKIFEIVFYSGALNRPLMAKSEKADKLVKGAVMALLALLGLYTLYTYGGLIPYRFVWQG